MGEGQNQGRDVFKARYMSECCWCGKKIMPGMPARSEAHNRFAHADCISAVRGLTEAADAKMAQRTLMGPGMKLLSGTGAQLAESFDESSRTWQTEQSDAEWLAESLEAVQARRQADGLEPLPGPSKDDAVASPEYAAAYLAEAKRLVSMATGPLAWSLRRTVHEQSPNGKDNGKV
jgi:hypothetical protein